MTLDSINEVTRSGPDETLSLGRYKDWLADGRRRIRLHDVLVEEIQRLRWRLGEEPFPVHNVPAPSVDDYLNRVTRYEAVTGPMLPILAVGGYWAGGEHAHLLGRCLARLADPPGDQSGTTSLLNLRLYPALLLVYACGIGAILGGRYETLANILVAARIRADNRRGALVRILSHNNVIRGDLLRQRPELTDHRTPTSDHIFDILTEPLASVAIDDVEYQAAFDRFEYLYALIHWDLQETEGPVGRIWGPMGRFLGRRRVLEDIEQEITEAGDNWPPLKAGLFGGSVERAKQVKSQIDRIVHQRAF